MTRLLLALSLFRRQPMPRRRSVVRTARANRGVRHADRGRLRGPQCPPAGKIRRHLSHGAWHMPHRRTSWERLGPMRSCYFRVEPTVKARDHD